MIQEVFYSFMKPVLELLKFNLKEIYMKLVQRNQAPIESQFNNIIHHIYKAHQFY
jgi:hypothetical protein